MFAENDEVNYPLYELLADALDHEAERLEYCQQAMELRATKAVA